MWFKIVGTKSTPETESTDFSIVRKKFLELSKTNPKIEKIAIKPIKTIPNYASKIFFGNEIARFNEVVKPGNLFFVKKIVFNQKIEIWGGPDRSIVS